MNDLELRAHDQLTRLAESMDPTPGLVDAVIRRGRRRKHVRDLTLPALAAVTALTVAVGISDQSGRPHPPITSDPGTTATAGARPGLPEVPVSSFDVGAPQLTVLHGGIADWQEPCNASQITARAELRPTAYGLAGVVAMQGKECSIRYTPGPSALLDSFKRPIVQAKSADTDMAINPPGNGRPDFALARGNAVWGFDWTGSWCGPAAAYVTVRLNDDPGFPSPKNLLLVPLDGPQLPCQGSSDTRMQTGLPGSPGQPTQLPPSQWQPLTLSVIAAEAKATEGSVTGVVAVITNPTDQQIHLSPCPRYAVQTETHTPNGTEFDDQGPNTLACDTGTLIAAHGQLRINIPSLTYGGGSPSGHGGLARGSSVTINLALAGILTASTTINVS